MRTKDNVVHGPAVALPDVKGIGRSLFDVLTKNKHVVAQIDGITGERDTYLQLLERSIRVAITMRSRGIKEGDVTATCCMNHLNTYVPMIASFFLGAVATTYHPKVTLPDAVGLIKRVPAKMIFVDPEAVELIERALEEADTKADIVVMMGGSTTKHSRFEDFLTPSARAEEESDFLPFEIHDTKETALIAFTSATMGVRKAISLSHLCLMGQRDPNINPFNLHDELIVLAFTPLFWISAIFSFLLCICNKYTRLVMGEYDPNTIWSTIAKFQVGALYMAPGLMLSLCKKGRPLDANTSSMMFTFVGGSVVSKAQIAEISAMMECPVVNIYALTELGGGGLALNAYGNSKDLEIFMDRPHTLGRPVAGFTYKVVDLESEEALGPYQQGELRIKSAFQMSGYYNMDDSEAYDADGFIKTGDVVYYDDDHSFYYVDRSKDIIVTKSWRVIPAKLESVLLTHRAVEAAVVIGLPHEQDGERAVAVVVPVKWANIDEVDIERYVREKVDDKYRLRGGVRFVERVPTSSSGKPLRRVVKDLVIRGDI